MTVDKLPPQNIEAEQSVLGSLLLDRDGVIKVAAFLQPDDFYRETHGRIFTAMLHLYERREPADLVTLCDELERRGYLDGIGGPAYLTSLVNTVPTSAHVEHYGRIVERAALRRRLIDAAARIAEIAFDETSDEVDDVIDRAEQLIFAVAQRRLARDLVPISKVLYDYFDQIEYLQQHQGLVLGTPSGYVDLDKLLGGFQPSDLIIVAGRPGMGKSSLMLSMAESIAAKQLGAIAIFSLEMSSDQLVQRLIAGETGIDSQRLRLGQIRDNEIDLVARAIGHLSEMPIYLDDSANISPFELCTKARRLHTEYPLSLVIVDYLQLMTGGVRSENRVQEISYISRSLKALARELRVPVMAASQLSRAVEARQNRRPQLADLRESGCLSGETLVYLPDQDIYRPIEQLVGQNEFCVLALNTQTWQLEPCQASRVFATGHKPVYRLTTRLGRSIRATANHQFLTVQGWRRLDELSMGMRIALPRKLFGPTHPTLYKANLSHERAARLARVVDSEDLARLAQSDVYWDEIVAIEPEGETEVFDLTIESLHNFVANDIIVHNSIEQDADVVMFIYRDEVYHPDTTYKNVAEVIVAKHRNGPTGKVELGFIQEQTKFVNLFREPVGM